MSSENIQKTDKIKKLIVSGSRLKELRSLLGVNQAEFSKMLGVKQNYLSRYENDDHEFTDDLKLKLVDIVLEKYQKRVNLDWLVSGSGDRFFSSYENALENPTMKGIIQLPVYSESELPEGSFVVPLLDQRLSAGSGSYLPESDETTALVHVPAYLSRFGKNIKALAVDGDSMYPTLSRGDMVVCDSCGWSGEGIYALRISGEGFVKRLTKAPGKLVIISDNPKYPLREEPEESEDIQIIGRVHCAIKELE